MDRTADLDAALSFVIGRIAEQAKLSGEPLSEQQRLLLNYLPSPTPAVWYPGIPEMLAALNEAGRALCVATSKRRDFAERVVDYLGFRQYLPRVYGALPGGGLDDKKDLLAEILRAESYDPARTTMVGDRLAFFLQHVGDDDVGSLLAETPSSRGAHT